eukprot:Filipodium_phascolosomae@DN2436_c0_g1_i4.p1
MQRRRIFFCPVCVNLIEENRRLRSVLADLLVALEHSERTNKRVMLEQTKTLMDLDEVQASKAKLQSEVQKLDQWLYETKLMEVFFMVLHSNIFLAKTTIAADRNKFAGIIAQKYSQGVFNAHFKNRQ